MDTTLIERNLRMAHMHKQGLTLEKIAGEFGITRERVRQVLKKMGIGREDGGISVSTMHRKAALVRAKQLSIARIESKWGCDIELWRELRANGIARAFEQQIANANRRGIKWALSFAEWYAVWQASGKLHLRGRGKNGYCLTRIKDSGGYELGNVHVQTIVANSREAVAKWAGKTKPIKGVYCLYPGRELAWLAKVGKVRLGYFASAELAGAARAAYLAAHPERGQQPVRGWAYLPKRSAVRPYQVVFRKKYIGCYATQEEAEVAFALAAEAV